MSNEKIISVIIPHKNSWGSLSILLDSIPPSDDIEIILVDDQSETPSGGRGPDHPNLLFLVNDTGTPGAGAARNIGIRHATGDWLIFADSDDRFLPKAFDLIREHMDLRWDLIFFEPTSINEHDGKPSNRHTDYSALVNDFCRRGSQWIRFRFHPPWSKLIRKNLITDNSIFFDECMVANDLVFSLKTGLSAKNIKAINTPIYCVTYSYHKGLSKRNSKSDFNTRFTNHIRYNKILADSGYRKYRMSMLSILTKSAKMNNYFFTILFIALKNRQPLINSGDFSKLKRRLLRKALKHN